MRLNRLNRLNRLFKLIPMVILVATVGVHAEEIRTFEDIKIEFKVEEDKIIYKVKEEDNFKEIEKAFNIKEGMLEELQEYTNFNFIEEGNIIEYIETKNEMKIKGKTKVREVIINVKEGFIMYDRENLSVEVIEEWGEQVKQEDNLVETPKEVIESSIEVIESSEEVLESSIEVIESSEEVLESSIEVIESSEEVLETIEVEIESIEEVIESSIEEVETSEEVVETNIEEVIESSEEVVETNIEEVIESSEEVIETIIEEVVESSIEDVEDDYDYYSKPENVGLQPHVAAFKEEVASKYGVTSFSTYRPGDPQDHGKGLAVDFMVPIQSQQGEDIAQYSVDNMYDKGISYVIWNQSIYGDWTNGQWQGMEDRGGVTANHLDHVHVSFY